MTGPTVILRVDFSKTKKEEGRGIRKFSHESQREKRVAWPGVSNAGGGNAASGCVWKTARYTCGRIRRWVWEKRGKKSSRNLARVTGSVQCPWTDVGKPERALENQEFNFGRFECEMFVRHTVEMSWVVYRSQELWREFCAGDTNSGVAVLEKSL